MQLVQSGPSHWYLVDAASGKKTRVSAAYVAQHRGGERKDERKGNPSGESKTNPHFFHEKPHRLLPKFKAKLERIARGCFPEIPDPNLEGIVFWLQRESHESEGAHVLSMLNVWDGYLWNVCTPPEARRKGYAEMLLKQVLAWARKRGLRSLALKVYADNTSAVKLYRKLRFRVDARSTKKENAASNTEREVLVMRIGLQKKRI